MDYFVIRLDLSKYFVGDKAKVILLCNTKWQNVQKLKERVEEIFQLENVQFKTADGFWIPLKEDIELLRFIDLVEVYGGSKNENQKEPKDDLVERTLDRHCHSKRKLDEMESGFASSTPNMQKKFKMNDLPKKTLIEINLEDRCFNKTLSNLNNDNCIAASTAAVEVGCGKSVNKQPEQPIDDSKYNNSDSLRSPEIKRRKRKRKPRARLSSYTIVMSNEDEGLNSSIPQTSALKSLIGDKSGIPSNLNESIADAIDSVSNHEKFVQPNKTLSMEKDNQINLTVTPHNDIQNESNNNTNENQSNESNNTNENQSNESNNTNENQSNESNNTNENQSNESNNTNENQTNESNNTNENQNNETSIQVGNENELKHHKKRRFRRRKTRNDSDVASTTLLEGNNEKCLNSYKSSDNNDSYSVLDTSIDLSKINPRVPLLNEENIKETEKENSLNKATIFTNSTIKDITCDKSNLETENSVMQKTLANREISLQEEEPVNNSKDLNDSKNNRAALKELWVDDFGKNRNSNSKGGDKDISKDGNAVAPQDSEKDSSANLNITSQRSNSSVEKNKSNFETSQGNVTDNSSACQESLTGSFSCRKNAGNSTNEEDSFMEDESFSVIALDSSVDDSKTSNFDKCSLDIEDSTKNVSATYNEKHSLNDHKLGISEMLPLAKELADLPDVGNIIIFKLQALKGGKYIGTTDYMAGICEYINKRCRTIKITLTDGESETSKISDVYFCNLDDTDDRRNLSIKFSDLIEPKIYN